MHLPMTCIAALAASWLLGCDSSSPLPGVSVDLAGGILTISNDGKTDLDECVVNLNSDWRLWKVAISAGRSGRYSVRDFTWGDLRFDPYTHKISNIMVHCFRPKGFAVFSSSF